VGGRGTLVGPILGAIGVNALQSWATVGKTAEYWLVILGALFVFFVLILPGGIVSIPARLKALWQFTTKKPSA
jgi:ABC-type branched-subunit amino acid transport system permease subunit